MVVGVVGEYGRCSGKGRCGGSGERFGGRGWEVWWERTGVVGGKEGVVGVADVDIHTHARMHREKPQSNL